MGDVKRPSKKAQLRQLLEVYQGKPSDPSSDPTEVLELLVEEDCGEDIHKRKVPCLHWAAERGYSELLEWLLQIGNNIEGITEIHQGATPLIAAVLGGHVECVTTLIEAGSDPSVSLEGIPCISLSLALAPFPKYQPSALRILDLLLSASAPASALDPVGCSPVHRAASLGLLAPLSALRKAEAPMAGRDYALNTPLHHAVCCLGEAGLACVRELVGDLEGEEGTLENISGLNPYTLALAMGNVEAAGVIKERLPALAEGEDARGRERKGQTMVLYSAECDKHAPGEHWGPESNRRMNTLIGEPFGALTGSEFADKVQYVHVTQPAAITDVLRVHEYTYIATLKQDCEDLRRREAAAAAAAAAQPPSPAPAVAHKRLDLDTVVTSASYDAAMVAAQAVVQAVDAVLDGSAPNAFCVVRPAGHHAGPRGAAKCHLGGGDPSAESLSHGFCLLSNVAIGAAHAMAVRGTDKGIRRVAIVDFDVHHGNGTEEVVRNLVPSKHAFESATPFGSFSLTSWNYKPWVTEEDPSNVFFCSIHACGSVTEEMGAKYADGTPCSGPFYPGTGKENPAPTDNILNIALGPKYGTAEFREAVEGRLLPQLDKFKPDMILLSAGFDAHMQDKMNYGLVNLLDDDYFWVTDRLRAVAEKWCAGRVVSVLEGGYNVNGLSLSPLARSAASHLRALCVLLQPTACVLDGGSWRAAEARSLFVVQHKCISDPRGHRCKPAPAAYEVQEGAVERLREKMKEVETVKAALAEGSTRSGRRKRKRPAVDYAALDQQLK